MYQDKAKQIKKFLASLGYDLESFGVKGKALYKKDALLFIDLLSDSEVAILGGDVYCLKSNGEITITFDNWFCDRDVNEDHRVYVQRSVDVTKRYIQGYNNTLFDINNILFDFVLESIDF